MNRDFSANILELDGTPARAPLDPKRILLAISRLPADLVSQVYAELEAEGATPTTFRAAACDAIMAPLEGDDKVAIEVKLRRFKLATRIAEGAAVELTLDEAKEIKDRVNKRYPGALIPARVAEFLEGN